MKSTNSTVIRKYNHFRIECVRKIVKMASQLGEHGAFQAPRAAQSQPKPGYVASIGRDIFFMLIPASKG